MTWSWKTFHKTPLQIWVWMIWLMSLDACFSMWSNLHLWVKRPAFGSSECPPLDKECFACSPPPHTHTHQRLVHLCFIRLIIPSFRVASLHDLHGEHLCEVWSECFSFIAAIRSLIRQTDSEQTDFACDDDSTATEVCVRWSLFSMCLWNELIMSVSHVLSFTQTHHSLTLRTTLAWGHRYWDPETSSRRFDGLVRVLFWTG